MTLETFQAQLKRDQARVAEFLGATLDGQIALDDAMRHAVLNGGKRLRAFLVYETMRICGGAKDAADHGAGAIELMHAYSLVHDDLPAMDDDDTRRGEPTLHVKWNEYTAILAGDALQAFAFEVLAKAPIEPANLLVLVQNLAEAAGRSGMVRGQFYDLEAESAGADLSLQDIENLQNEKTGALIAWSAAYGARATGSDPQPFLDYAQHLGLAFQIWDDVLDETSTSEVLGKTAGKDTQAGKATFVTALGLDGAKARAHEEVELAKRAIENIPQAQNLSDLADFVITRSY